MLLLIFVLKTTDTLGILIEGKTSDTDSLL